MTEIAEGGPVPMQEPPASGPMVMESDFSPRKLKIAAGIILGQTFATSILPFMAVGFATIPMTSEFGWSRTDYSWATTFIFIFGALSLWPIGRLADRVGVRPVLIFGTIVVGLLTIALSFQTKSLVMLYTIYGLLGVFGSTGVTYMKIIAALYTRNRGRAMAILGAEATIVGAFIPPVVAWLITTYGWRFLYLVFGIVILAVVPILIFTIEEPGQRGIRFRSASRDDTPPPKAVTFEGLTLFEAMQTRAFWIMTLAALSGMFMLTGMGPHMVPAIIAKGFSVEQAAWVISLTTFAGFVGTLVGGWAVDYAPTAKVAAPFSLISAIGAVLLLLVTATWGGMPLLIASVALGGFAFFAARPMGAYFHTRFFGLRAFTEIMGVLFMIVNLISGAAPPLIGWIFDTTHSYEIAFYMMIASALIGTVCFLLLPIYRYDKNIGQMPVETPTASAATVVEAAAI